MEPPVLEVQDSVCSLGQLEVVRHQDHGQLTVVPELKEEIMEQMSEIRAWGGRFVVPIPEVKVYQ